jgi:D-3-phosphoglycerate dehydrogenase
MKILITPQTFIKNELLMSQVNKLGQEMSLEIYTCDCKSSPLSKHLSTIKPNIIILGLEEINEHILRENPQLKFISKFGVGLDNIDTNILEKFEVKLGWTPGVNKRSVSELTLSYALGHFRNVFHSSNLMKKGVWEKNGGRILSNSIFGLVGFGNIGQDVADLLMNFGCKIVYNDILDKTYEAKKSGAIFMPIEDLFAQSDIISFHLPSTPITKNMFNNKAINLTKKSPFIINTSRGDIVDFQATVSAVENQKLSGFASDVFAEEPLNTSKWCENDNLIFTPHIGGNAREAVIAMGNSAINHIRNFIHSL